MAGALALALLLAAPAAVLAHGALQRSAPASGAHLSAAPRELRLTFSEDVELVFARVQLLGPDSARVALTPLALAADSPRVLIAGIAGPLTAGAYRVAWQVAGADGHPVRGEYSFVIAPGATGLSHPEGPPAPGGTSPPATHHEATSLPSGPGFDAGSPLYVLVRWLTFLGLLGVIGAVAFRLAVLPRVRSGADALLVPAAAAAARIGAAAAALLAVATLLRLFAQSYALHGAGGALDAGLIGTMLTRTLWGWGWLLQAGGAALALTGFLRARPAAAVPTPVEAAPAEASAGAPTPEALTEVAEPGPEGADAGTVSRPPTVPAPAGGAGAPRRGWALAALGALALAVTPALSGHAAAVPRITAFAVLADAIHVLAAGGWIGGLLLVLAAGVPAALRLPSGERGPAVAGLVNAFSPTALVFAAALTGTGLLAAWLHLGSVPALWQSDYGRTLLLKLGVLSLVFGTGAYNFLRVKPALGDERGVARLRRSATVEIVVGVLVLAVTAVLVATATPVRP